MLGTRTINIALKEQLPQARKIKFLPKLTSAGSELLLQNYYEVATNASGVGSIDLPVKATGTIKYTVIIPTDAGPIPSVFYLSPGAAVDLSDLIAAGGAAADSVKDYVTAAAAGAAHQVFPGNYPNASMPPVYLSNSISGHNDLYTVPTGRKAIVFDIIVTNNTGGSITYYPEIKISGTYYRTGANSTESAAGLGHNYGMLASKSAPILLNAGETFAVNTDAIDLTIWGNIVEFDDSSPLNRADIRTWSVGNNTLFTVPAGETVAFGLPGLTAANLPAQNITGMIYVNGSGSSRTISGIYIVPSGGSAGNQNQFAGLNTVGDRTIFSKYFHGNLAPGVQIILVVDSAAAGQFAWMIYAAFY